jgi:hypothetical protein
MMMIYTICLIRTIYTIGTVGISFTHNRHVTG